MGIQRLLGKPRVVELMCDDPFVVHRIELEYLNRGYEAVQVAPAAALRACWAPGTARASPAVLLRPIHLPHRSVGRSTATCRLVPTPNSAVFRWTTRRF